MFKLKADPRIQMHGFICGSGHSGTTLMANILASHRDLFVPRKETRLFVTHKFKRAGRYRGLIKDAVRSDVTRFVEKTPGHIRHIDEIRAEIPSPKFLIPVRDGRDVAASVYKRFGDKQRGINSWQLANNIVADQIGKSDVLIYRHEDLVTDLEGKLREICAFFEIEYYDDLLNYHENPQNWHGLNKLEQTDKETGRHHNVRRNWQVNQPVHDTSGKWKKTMTRADLIDLYEGRGRELMEIFGYDLSDT